jgi:peptide chain release factor 2
MTRLETAMADPDFWNHQEAAQSTIANLRVARSIVQQYTALETEIADADVLAELAEEEEDAVSAAEAAGATGMLEAKLERFELKSLLSGEYDPLGAILEINAGAGGTESQDWAAMLFRMYERWAEREGYKTEVLDIQDGQEAGIKGAAMEVDGDFVYGNLRSEVGVHRLVRISPFDAQSRRHTSFASVMVMPLLEEGGSVEINPDDLKVDTYRASGAGGQHVNKTESAIRITHLPSGVVVTCQSERSQHRNRDSAMRMLRSKLALRQLEEEQKKRAELQGEKKAIEWSSQIRSYVFQPYTMVKDHRTGHETGNVQAVMDGDIAGFMDAFLRTRRDQRAGK